MHKADQPTIDSLPAKDDKKSFNRLFAVYYPRLTAYAHLFLEKEAAEDVVQELFVYIWEHMDGIKIHTSLEAYLFKSTYQRCLNQIKHHKMKETHHKQLENRFAEMEHRIFNPDTDESIRKLFMSDLKKEMRNAINELPDRCREVFMLSYVYQLKNKEIAEALNISVNTVENHMTNALKTLRMKLKKYMHVFVILGIGCA